MNIQRLAIQEAIASLGLKTQGEDIVYHLGLGPWGEVPHQGM